MKTDLPLSVRHRKAAEAQQEIRAALVRRHVSVVDEQHPIEGAQVGLGSRGPEFEALAELTRD